MKERSTGQTAWWRKNVGSIWGATGVNRYMDKSAVDSFTIRRPLLSDDALGRARPEWTRHSHIPAQNEMRPRMRSAKVLESRLECYILPRGWVYCCVDNFTRECCVEHQGGIWWWYTSGDGKCCWEVKGKIPTNVVWNRVGNPDISESTGGNLEVVVWVTPRPKAVIIRVWKDRRMIKARGIYFLVRAEIQSSWREILPFVQSQYGWTPSYPHSDLNLSSKVWRYARCHGRKKAVLWIWKQVGIWDSGVIEKFGPTKTLRSMWMYTKSARLYQKGDQVNEKHFTIIIRTVGSQRWNQWERRVYGSSNLGIVR